MIQTAGRCNRNNERDKGNVNIVILKDEKQEFYKYIYDSTLIDATRGVIGTFSGTVEEKDFVPSSVDEYYKIVLERGSKDDSRNILESIVKLDFSRTAEFNLIQEKLPTVSFFVEIDEKAEEIRKRMEEIFESKKTFDQKLEIARIRKDINNYTIQLRCFPQKLANAILNIDPIDKMEDYRYIQRSEVSKYYKIDSGLNIEKGDDIAGYTW